MLEVNETKEQKEAAILVCDLCGAQAIQFIRIGKDTKLSKVCGGH